MLTLRVRVQELPVMKQVLLVWKAVRMWQSQNKPGERVGLEVSSISFSERAGLHAMLDNAEPAVLVEHASCLIADGEIAEGKTGHLILMQALRENAVIVLVSVVIQGRIVDLMWQAYVLVEQVRIEVLLTI